MQQPEPLLRASFFFLFVSLGLVHQKIQGLGAQGTQEDPTPGSLCLALFGVPGAAAGQHCQAGCRGRAQAQEGGMWEEASQTLQQTLYRREVQGDAISQREQRHDLGCNSARQPALSAEKACMQATAAVGCLRQPTITDQHCRQGQRVIMETKRSIHSALHRRESWAGLDPKP